MTCKCGSDRSMSVSGKTSDMCSITTDVGEHDGYVPAGLNIGEFFGDYLEFDVCLDCGTIQGDWPLSDEAIQKALKS